MYKQLLTRIVPTDRIYNNWVGQGQLYIRRTEKLKLQDPLLYYELYSAWMNFISSLSRIYEWHIYLDNQPRTILNENVNINCACAIASVPVLSPRMPHVELIMPRGMLGEDLLDTKVLVFVVIGCEKWICNNDIQ